jgi:hypothetical protein
MRETILQDALEEIKKLDWQNWQAHEIAINALNAFSYAPESGGEENGLINFIKYLFMEAQKGGGYTKETEDYFVSKFKDFVPSVQSSDVTPVASHSVYDNNSTQLKKILVFAPADGKPHIAKITVNENDSTIEWIEPTSTSSIEQEKKFVGYFHIPCEEHDPIEVEQTSLSTGGKIQKKTWWQCSKCGLFLTPNSEQEDKRSVATKSNQGGDAGNIKTNSEEWYLDTEGKYPLSKEEGKDELRKRAEYWEQRCGYAEYMMGIDAGKLQPQYSQWRALKENGLKGEGD